MGNRNTGPIRLDGIEMVGEKQVILVNPNAERPYEDTIGGRRYDFEPFRKKSVGSALATMLLTGARKRQIDARRQADAEISEFETMTEQGGTLKHRARQRFVDPKTQEPPRTKPWPFCPLLNLGVPADMGIFHEALDVAVETGKVQIEEDLETMFKKVLLPKDSWEKKQFAEFINDHGGTCSFNETEGKLLERAMNLFRVNFKLRQEDGFGIVDEETGKVVRAEDLGLETPAEDLGAGEGA